MLTPSTAPSEPRGAGATPTRRVLLLGPIAGRDHLSGDTTYVESLLTCPPPGVEYTPYDRALADGTLTIRGRRPKHGRPAIADGALLPVRALEKVMRSRFMFREPTWFVTCAPGAFDLVHAHLFPVRQIGPVQLPVVTGAGYPLADLYRTRERWPEWRVRLAARLENWWARSLRIDGPEHAGGRHSVTTVYSEHFRRHLIDSGSDPERVIVASTALPPDDTIESVDSIADETPVTVGFVGRDFVRKGGPAALAAFEHLAGAHPEWRFLVVSKAEALDQHVGSLPPNIEICDEVSRHDLLERVLPSLDVLVLPSELDCGAPLTVLEALRAGVSVVLSRSPWLDERLGGPAISRATTPAEVVEAVEELVAVAARSDRRKAAHHLWEREFTMTSLHEALDVAYDRAAGIVSRHGQTPLDVVVAGRAKELAGAPFDGFAMRDTGLLAVLAEHHRVHVVLLDPEGEPFVDEASIEATGVHSVSRVAVPRVVDTRLRRLTEMRAGVREPADLPWERQLVDITQRFRPDAVVTLGPWLGAEFRVLHRDWPSVHFFEEDLTAMAELAPQSGQARVLRRLSTWAVGHRHSQPAAVVAISPTELQAAARWAPRARAEVIRLTLSPDEWPTATGPSTGSRVVVVGNLGEGRNAEGLAAVLHEVQRRGLEDALEFRIVTGAGAHSSLEPFVGLPWVDAGPERGSLYDEYRASRVALVPAFRASGMKTTILQAWATGCPVVCSEVCAAGVGEPTDGGAVAAGADASEIIDRLLELTSNATAADALTSAGFARLTRRFDRHALDGHVLDIVESLAVSRGAR